MNKPHDYDNNKPPEKIFLSIRMITPDDGICFYPEFEWERNLESDIEYVRADIHQKALDELSRANLIIDLCKMANK